MEIQRLKSEIIANIRSSSTINNVTQCITELVLNSLDGKSTSVAVRVNLVTFKIQVVDNGEGITQENLKLVGLRYMTNKCSNIVHLEKHIKYHGFRGEALASIINISKKVNITSKHVNLTETYAKNFGKNIDNQVISVKNRPSFGTTVTVEGFLNNLPIRRKRIIPELELEDVKRSIESLIILYPGVSFSVRNDLTGNLMIISQKNKDIISSFTCLHPEIDAERSLMKVSKDKITVEALLFKGLFATKHLQYVYVNRRPIHCTKIQKFVSNLFLKNKDFDKKNYLNSKIVTDKNKHPVYVINIKCPHSQVDILLNPSKTLVEFKNWTIILRCLEKLVYSFFGNDNKLSSNAKYLTSGEEIKSCGGVSQIYGAFKSYGYKRQKSEEDVAKIKVQKLCSQNTDVIEGSDFTVEDGELAIDTIKPISDFIPEKNFISSQKPFNKYRNDEDIPNKMSIEDEQIKSLFSNISKNCMKLPIDKRETDKNIDKPDSDNDIYDISNSTPPKKTKAKAFKKPLPIKIKQKNVETENLQALPSLSELIAKCHSSMHVSPYMDENKHCNINRYLSTIKNNVNQPTLIQIVPNKIDEEKSTLSKFTADENKGKHLIMDMFLKSTQVYSTEDDNLSETRSDETILEVESNFLLENNIQTKVNGLSKATSMSVNIRSTKRIKKHKPKANRAEKINRASKCIQTTIDQNKMISKCIQTTLDQNWLKSKRGHRCEDINDIFIGKKPADFENYTIVLSDSVHPKGAPRFRFAYQNSLHLKSEPINKFTSSCNNCRCNCHLNSSKIFHFVDSVYKKSQKEATENVLKNNIDSFGSGCDLSEIDVSSIKKFDAGGETENYDDKRKAINPMQAGINRFVQNNDQYNQQHLNNVMYRNYELVKLREDGKTKNYDEIKRTEGNSQVNWFVQNYDRFKQQHPNNVVYRNCEPAKLREERKAENYGEIKCTAGNPQMNWLVQNYGQFKQQHPNNVVYRNYKPAKLHADGKTENYDEIKRTAGNPQVNWFVQNYGQYKQQHPDNVVYRSYEPVPLCKGGEIGNYGEMKCTAGNPPLNRFVQNYGQYKQHLDNVCKNYESVPLREGGETENYEDIKHTTRNPEINRFEQHYDQHKQHYGQHKQYLNNVLRRNYEPVPTTTPNIFPYQEGFITRQKKSNKSLQGMLDFDRSPYFISSRNTLYPKTNLGQFNRYHDNGFNKNNSSTPFPTKKQNFHNADSYGLFDPQYRSTQLADHLNSRDHVGRGTNQNRGFCMVPNNADSYELFAPQYRSTQLRDFNADNYLDLKNCADSGRDPLHNEHLSEIDFTIDPIDDFRPVYKSTQRDPTKCVSIRNSQQQNEVHTSFAECIESSFNPQLKNVSEDVCENLNPSDHFLTNFNKSIHFNTQNNCKPHTDLDIPRQGNISPENVEINHLPSKQKPAIKGAELNRHSDKQSELIITLSDQEKEQLLRSELEAEKDLNAKKGLDWDSPPSVPGLQENTQRSDYQQFGKVWVKGKNNLGLSFYMNKRTGFTTFLAPKSNDNQFKFGRRFEFMPKGLSPILRDVKQVDQSLNQNDKEKLQVYILESHQNELLTIKWQNYMKHNDPKTFFDEVYKEKVKLFKDCLPKMDVFDGKKYVPELYDVMHFNKKVFDSISVIGQVDGKFIAVVEKTKNLLIVFDQHAVHERIRLEELLKVYTNAKAKWVEKLILFIPQNDLSLLKKHELYLSTLGLSVEFFMNGVNISEIPLCIYNKFKDNDNQNSLIEMIQLLINEIIELLKETRGVCFGNLPRIIQNIINLEACRGAIKFGDNLSKKDCVDLLDRLAVCKLPFQCAHGRPTLTPLVRLNLTQKCVPYKVNLKKTVDMLCV